MITTRWDDKPYYSLNTYFKNVYGEKIYKVAIDGGMTCPNRDGSLGTRGCIFCSEGGSGEFAASFDRLHPNIEKQLKEGKALIQDKFPSGRFVAYFQPFTNTYAPIPHLRALYTATLLDEDVVGLSIATRPDCLSEPVLHLLEDLQMEYPDKFIWIELGLQTIHRKSAEYIRRGYDLSVFETAVKNLHAISIPTIVHVILGLPGESKADMLSTVEYLNTFPIFGAKLQLLHVLKGTDLSLEYADRKFEVLSMAEYIDILIDCIECLNPDIVLHRVTGDGPKNLLLAPTWSTNKKVVLNTLLHEMSTRGAYQGRRFTPSPFAL